MPARANRPPRDLWAAGPRTERQTMLLAIGLIAALGVVIIYDHEYRERE